MLIVVISVVCSAGFLLTRVGQLAALDQQVRQLESFGAADAPEPGLFDHSREAGLVGKAPDALDEILVGIAVAADDPSDFDGRDLEPETRHLWIEEDGLPVAYLRLLTERATDQPPTDQPARPESAPESATGHADGQEELRIGRVLVAEGHRGRGLAERLMKAALEVVDGRPCRLDAQSYLVDWYRRLGFEPSGEEFLEDGIPHVPMRQSSRSLA